MACSIPYQGENFDSYSDLLKDHPEAITALRDIPEFDIEIGKQFKDHLVGMGYSEEKVDLIMSRGGSSLEVIENLEKVLKAPKMSKLTDLKELEVFLFLASDGTKYMKKLLERIRNLFQNRQELKDYAVGVSDFFADPLDHQHMQEKAGLAGFLSRWKDEATRIGTDSIYSPISAMGTATLKHFKKSFTESETVPFRDFINSITTATFHANTAPSTQSSLATENANKSELQESLIKHTKIIKEKLRREKEQIAKADPKELKKLRTLIKTLEQQVLETEQKLESSGYVNILSYMEEDTKDSLEEINERMAQNTLPSDTGFFLAKLEEYLAFHGDILSDIINFENDPNFIADVDLREYIKETARELSVSFNTIMEAHKELSLRHAKEVLAKQSTAKGFDVAAEHFAEAFGNVTEDISSSIKFMGLFSSSDSDVVRLIRSMLVDLNKKVIFENLDYSKDFIKKVDELGFLNENIDFVGEVDENGVPTGYISQERHMGKFLAARQKVREAKLIELGYDTEEKRKELNEQGKEFKKTDTLGIELTDANYATLADYQTVDAFMKEWQLKNTEINIPEGRTVTEHVEHMKATLSETAFGEWFNEHMAQDTSTEASLEIADFYKDGLSYYTPSIYSELKAPKISLYASEAWSNTTPEQKKLIDFFAKEKESMDSELLGQGKPLLLPQMLVSKSNAIRYGKKSALGTLLKESVEKSIEDTEFGFDVPEDKIEGAGELPLGLSGHKIPAYYTKKLDADKMNALSTDFVASFLEYHKMKTNFKIKMQALPDIQTVHREVGRNKYVTPKGNIAGTETNLYEAIQFLMEGQIFGITKDDHPVEIAGKKYSLSKLLDSVINYSRTLNLGWNVVSATAGFLNAAGLSRVEATIGEHTTHTAMNKGKMLMLQNISAIGAEMLKPVKTNKIGIIIEHFGVGGKNFSNTNMEEAYRALIEGSNLYLPFELADYHLKGNMVLSMLEDTKVINGRSYTSYQAKRKGLLTEYNAATSVLEQLEVVDNKLKFPEGFSVQQQINLATKMDIMNASLDGILLQEDKGAIHRSLLGRIFTIHRGWAFSGFAKRFRSKGNNYDSGVQEVGQYRALGDLIAGSFTPSDQFKLDKIKQAIAKWESLDDYEKVAVRRALGEMLLLVAIGTLAVLLNKAAGSDDEGEDKKGNYALDLAAYVMTRVTLETASMVPIMITSPIGLDDGKFQSPITLPMFVEALAIFEDPTTLTRQLEHISNLADIFQPATERGKYRGLSGVSRTVVKALPGIRGAYMLRDPAAANNFMKYKALGFIY